MKKFAILTRSPEIGVLWPAVCWFFECCGSMFKVDPVLMFLGYHWICVQASTKIVQTCVMNMIHEAFLPDEFKNNTFVDWWEWNCTGNEYIISQSVLATMTLQRKSRMKLVNKLMQFFEVRVCMRVSRISHLLRICLGTETDSMRQSG